STESSADRTHEVLPHWTVSSVAEQIDRRLKDWQIRFEKSLVVFPTTNGPRVKGLADGFVGRWAEHFSTRSLAVIKALPFPWQAKELHRAPLLLFQSRHGVLVPHFQPGRGDHFTKSPPDAHVIGIALGRALKSKETNAVRVERQILHETTDHNVARITQRDQQ